MMTPMHPVSTTRITNEDIRQAAEHDAQIKKDLTGSVAFGAMEFKGQYSEAAVRNEIERLEKSIESAKTRQQDALRDEHLSSAEKRSIDRWETGVISMCEWDLGFAEKLASFLAKHADAIRDIIDGMQAGAAEALGV